MINSIANTCNSAYQFGKNFAISPDLLFSDCTTLAKKALVNLVEKRAAEESKPTFDSVHCNSSSPTFLSNLHIS